MLKFIWTTFQGAHRRTLLKGYFLKRALDLILAGAALIALSPLLLAVALAIKLTSRGPVLYWQKRVGWDCREFDFPKLRSMRSDSDATRQALLAGNQHGQSGITFKMKNDPRITRVGQFIRKFSIDELPQLWCVLTGQMSIVGPRPPLPAEVARYDPEHRMRLMMIPGLTGIWQVSGRSDVPFGEQFEMDLMYLAHYSPKLDLQVILQTIPAVLKSKGAY